MWCLCALILFFAKKRVKQVKDPTATLWSNIVGLTILTSLLKSRSANTDQPGPFRLAHHGWTQKWAVRAPNGSISHIMREHLVVPPSRSTLSYRSSLQPPAMHSHGQCHVGDNLSSRVFLYTADTLLPIMALLVFEDRLWTFWWIFIHAYYYSIIGDISLMINWFFILFLYVGYPKSNLSNLPQPVGCGYGGLGCFTCYVLLWRQYSN
jgi:hypothetical protein